MNFTAVERLRDDTKKDSFEKIRKKGQLGRKSTDWEIWDPEILDEDEIIMNSPVTNSSHPRNPGSPSENGFLEAMRFGGDWTP